MIIMNYQKTNLYGLLFSILLLSSCGSARDIAYFQKHDNKTIAYEQQRKSTEISNSQTKSTNSLKSAELRPLSNTSSIYNVEKNSAGLYDARIKPKDILSITVVSSEPEASRIYNLLVPQVAEASNNTNILSQPVLQTYLVDNDGNIDFPVFGRIKVTGLTRKDLESLLQKKLSTAFSKESPIISIRFLNYSVNILGEVQRPGKFETSNERVTIFEGLAMAGDLTIYGRRDNVTVLRENLDGTKEYITLNLNDKNVIYSPAYYLEQNDVVYVEPNKSRSKSSNYGAAESFGISSLSVLLSVTSLIFTVFGVKF